MMFRTGLFKITARILIRSGHSKLCLRPMSQGFFVGNVPYHEEIMPEQPSATEKKRSLEAVEKFKQLCLDSINGGGPRGIDRHVKKNKKMLVRDRIKHIIDPGTEFLEIGGLAGFDMDYGDIPGAGMVAGIGKVCGIYCVIGGNDATVKGGTYFPITLKKSLRVQALAESIRLPHIYIPDSGGAYLPLQSEIFLRGGRGFYNQAVMSSKGIPQIAVVCGSCTAGAAYNPTMSDEAIIVDKIGKIYLGGPPLVRAATGEIVSDEDLGGAFLHSSTSGCTDYFARTEEEVFLICRDVVESLNMQKIECNTSYSEPPQNISPDFTGKEHFDKADIYSIISSVVDGGKFKEFKTLFGPGLVAGTAYVQGFMVGIIANCDEILSAEALKASHFMTICNMRNTPLIFLQNSLPIERRSTKVDAMLIKDRAKMSATLATVSVPKIVVTISGCHGDENALMCGPSFDPTFNISWPTAKFTTLAMDFGEPESTITAFDAAFHMLLDMVILPESTRDILGELLRTVSQQYQNPERASAVPIFRM